MFLTELENIFSEIERAISKELYFQQRWVFEIVDHFQ